MSEIESSRIESSETGSSAVPSSDGGASPSPGPVAWVAIVIGWGVMAVAVISAFGDPDLKGSTSWAVWILGAAIVHDAVVLPVALGVGWVIGRVLPRPWRTPARVTLAIAAIVALATWPIVQRWGARDDNPSILPLDTDRNLVLIVSTLIGAAVVAGWLNLLRGGSGRDDTTAGPPTDEPTPGPSDLDTGVTP